MFLLLRGEAIKTDRASTKLYRSVIASIAIHLTEESDSRLRAVKLLLPDSTPSWRNGQVHID